MILNPLIDRFEKRLPPEINFDQVNRGLSPIVFPHSSKLFNSFVDFKLK